MPKKIIPNLQVERTSNQTNMFYLSVLQYRKEHHLVIVDNITDEYVSAYMIDRAAQEGVDVQELLSIITRWFYESSEKHPISIEFSKLGLTSKVNRILKNFDLNHVTRLVGCDFKYNLNDEPKVKRRRVQKVQTPEVEIPLSGIA